ncbi:hypothetical protein [Haliscomenobacter hydrossis]|uniref:Glycoside hydrolase family 65 n=1 Tax=Haliscomenobacter hydrossis (strain ATCC 27775 / DSM 1100 / LMG 10767 / O) TaxID=760192 RepID=F4KPW1_HALH1|nr:hypothetical protein [Haliscomenobacter hydrossis]AEE52211.1 hypothetical protein Halhy_4367 [Haliscomenobacter hydrossis DSM 1100]
MSKHLALLISAILFCTLFLTAQTGKIDRKKLVLRHTIRHAETTPFSPLSVGNGRFAFTADITGLQSFPEHYEPGIPLGTQSDWGWHYPLNPRGFKVSDSYKPYQVGDRQVNYAYRYTANMDTFKAKASDWLRESPHRIHLGMIGLEMVKKDGSTVSITDLQNPQQELNLWTGQMSSTFAIEGQSVKVETLGNPDLDGVSVRISSSLLREGRLKIKIRLPLGVPQRLSYSFAQNQSHQSALLTQKNHRALLSHQQDNDRYYLGIRHSEGQIQAGDAHTWLIIPGSNKERFELSVVFNQKEFPLNRIPNYDSIQTANAKSWSRFWKSGGAVDFSQCTDPRAKELERRVVLSQYLTRINCAGTLPPQETGLTYNSWNGKFHMEMHWWHGVHFPMWQRAEYLRAQMPYYANIVEKAKATAQMQGYAGVRWPKMTGPKGDESPSSIGPFLIWQQPHYIYLVELLYRDKPNKNTLKKYQDLVFATAEFMASYARWDEKRQQYILGPALIPAQENFRPETTINPPFELTYWRWALRTAQEWRKRAGLNPEPKWQKVIDNLAPLATRDGLYLFSENAVDSYVDSSFLHDHPMIAGTLGMLPPSPEVDPAVLEKSLNALWDIWDWQSTWGWDYPMLAMSAAYLKKPDWAVSYLSMKTVKNTYLTNGHNYQRFDLSIYLPGNGGLLAAVALLCTKDGWPKDGQWAVRWEKLKSL